MSAIKNMFSTLVEISKECGRLMMSSAPLMDKHFLTCCVFCVQQVCVHSFIVCTTTYLDDAARNAVLLFVAGVHDDLWRFCNTYRRDDVTLKPKDLAALEDKPPASASG